MSVWCTLLGHRFGEATVERDREVGEEEVITISREIEECDRCDARRIVSENTEIAAVDPAPDDIDPTESGEQSGSDRPGAGALGGVPSSSDTTARADPDEEGAEILSQDTGRKHGEWPAESDEPRTRAEPSGDGEVVSENGESRYRCPACGFVERAENSSLRAGDNCPDCRSGYLERT